jgi:hypothetical protein
VPCSGNKPSLNSFVNPQMCLLIMYHAQSGMVTMLTMTN